MLWQKAWRLPTKYFYNDKYFYLLNIKIIGLNPSNQRHPRSILPINQKYFLKIRLNPPTLCHPRSILPVNQKYLL